MPAKMEQGAYHMYRFILKPDLAALGRSRRTDDALEGRCGCIDRSGLYRHLRFDGHCHDLSGFFIGKYLNMYPIESAIVTGCHSGLGGTGDVAILSASNRMELMPFAQISTVMAAHA